jgi:class 3 adenylate cyclase
LYDTQLEYVMDRKLAAILAADVVGYSALMERDEAGTFARLKAGRKELFEPEIDGWKKAGLPYCATLEQLAKHPSFVRLPECIGQHAD